MLAGAPGLVRARVVDPAFVADCGPWLDATALWARALVATLDGLDARLAGDGATASARLAEASALVAQRRRSTPSRARPVPRGRWVADGVLDDFLAGAAGLG